jgi:hypothetical protein
MKPILCIDPGASGGLALLNREGNVEAFPMRDGMTEQIDAIRHIAATNPGLTAIIEKVGFHRPGNSAVSTAKFARHCGHLEAALYSVGVPFEDVAPGTWMKALGALPADKTARKNAIKEQVARRFPHLDVTLKTADALGMLVWAMQRSN